MAPACFVVLVFGGEVELLLCPQALVVMFLRQSQGGYDSLGAAGSPDLAVALIYGPLVGWILSHADREGRLRRVAFRAAFLHIAAVGLALLAWEFRNYVWGHAR